MKDPIRVTSFTRTWRSFRRLFTRSEWVIWLLGLKRFEGTPVERGLIMVQIDGLSQTQLERSLADGHMPFLASLLENEHYQIHTFYSGLPSSTPAVQAELYYGARTAVPAFGFREHESGRLVRMFANEIAEEIEQKISQSKTGLLFGGTSYCNIYSGGAKEAWFCATSFGWSEFFKTLNPFNLLVVMVFNFFLFFRVVGLMFVELFLAFFGFVRGIFSGREFWQELIMIPARVVVVVMLRELVTVGVCYDAARGLPIVHLNLLGYDEQAHRRGPGSPFAHWTLKGIDHAIHRIWKAAHLGAGREYDLWIFSDHGQEATRPYEREHNKSIQEVVAGIVDGEMGQDDSEPTAEQESAPKGKHARHLPTRANWLGIGWLVSMLFGEQDHDIQSRSKHVQTVTSGPVGFVYLLTPEAKRLGVDLAKRLVAEFHMPMTATPLPGDRVQIHTQEGSYQLPGDAVQVFGAEHPFLDDVTDDLIRMVHHDDAGDFTLIGWTHRKESTSFVLQNGAHAGPGIEETRGFALLPNDAPIPETVKRYLRPDDLRLTALRFLGRDSQGEPIRKVRLPADRNIRIMTYNVHACVGMDGQLSPERIARVIGQSGASIICLQEVDVFRHRSGNRDQAHAIARFLEMNHHFHPAWHIQEERFGNAILTQFPMTIVQAEGLHHHKEDRSRRSALWADIDIGNGVSLQVINAHLSIYPQEQVTQARQLFEEWVQPAQLLGPVILCGDFNARPNSKTHQTFSEHLTDVDSADNKKTRSTYFSPWPLARVDHIFVTDDLVPKRVSVVSSRMAKMASDHLPLVSDIKLHANT